MEFTSAFVLHQRPYRETSLLVDLFTQSTGRVSLVARGARQKRKRQQTFPQLFQPFDVNWYGYGELVNLKQFDISRPAYLLKGDASLCGLYLNELLVRLLPLHEAEAELFLSYQKTLSLLQDGSNNEVALRLFEKQLLTQLGYGLQLEYEASSGIELDDERQYHYRLDSGPHISTDIKLKPTISGRSLRHLREESGFDMQSLVEIKRLMRFIIDHYLSGRPLQSRILFAQFKQLHP